MTCPTDLESVVLGISMQLTPNLAAPQLARVDVRDFVDWRAAAVAELLVSAIRAGLPSLNPATLVGYALSHGAVSGEHRLSQVSKWMAGAYSCPVPGIALAYHVDLLIEASYRRAAAEYAASIHQARLANSLDTLDDLIHSGFSRLVLHRNRIQPCSANTEVAA
jgi:hypothetical protein